MHVLLAVAENAERWHEAFAARLPEATIARWPADHPHEVDYAAVWKPDPEAFRRVEVRRAIFNLGAGVDALLDVPTLPPDIPIVRLEDAGMASQMAEYAVLAVLREFREAQHYVHAQRAGRWSPQRPRDRRTFGIGVMGAGVLAQAVLAALQPFGFPLATWSRMPHALPGVESFAGRERLPAFLARSKMLIALLPSTDETRGLLDADAFALLPSGAHIVNLGRGDLIVETALIAALNRGHIAHATLDVFREEPLPPKHPFWHHSAITVTPHVSAVTSVADSVAQVVAKIRALERGELVSGVVDRTKGY
ncbi:MAG TPA: glyoxylate/hydroxypyruvate reductase A [Casimicrobiaceae bacterium]|jgi:glyoxylate/hydroxypyruvate reductase A